MMTYSQIQEYCNDLGYVDNSKTAHNSVQYVKIQRWSDKEGYHKVGEKHTVCKMKLPVVESTVYNEYMKIRLAINRYINGITADQAIEQFAAIGVKAWKTNKGLTSVQPTRYEYDITPEQLKEFVDKGMKWEAVRENKKLERMINAL